MTFWMNEGSLVTNGGSAVNCDDCPCDEGCGPELPRHNQTLTCCGENVTLPCRLYLSVTNSNDTTVLPNGTYPLDWNQTFNGWIHDRSCGVNERFRFFCTGFAFQLWYEGDDVILSDKVAYGLGQYQCSPFLTVKATKSNLIRPCKSGGTCCNPSTFDSDGADFQVSE